MLDLHECVLWVCRVLMLTHNIWIRGQCNAEYKYSGHNQMNTHQVQQLHLPPLSTLIGG